MNIFNNLKNNIYKVINEVKENIRIEENKKNEFSSKIKTIDKFLNINDNESDFSKSTKKNIKFYIDTVIPLLISEVTNYTEYLLRNNPDNDEINNYMKQLNALNSIDDKVIKICSEIKTYLEYEKEKHNTDQLKKKRNEVKTILSNIDNKKYLDDMNIINEINNFMKNNTDLESYEIDNITSYMIDEYNKKLELKQQRQLQKKEIIKPIILDDTPMIIEEQQEKVEYNVFNDEDKELLKEVNDVIFLNINKLKSLSSEYIKTIEENIELFEDDEYKSDIILYKLNVILNKIFRIQDILDSKINMSENSLNRYTNFKDKLMMKLENLYVEYLDINKIEENKVDNKNKKTLIYLTNKNDKLYFDINKIDKENYSSILKMLEELENGFISSSKVKDCSYIYPIKLKGLFRKRRNSSRIIYIPYNEYMFILTVYIKNTSYTKYINEYLEHIADSTRNDIKKLKKDLQNPQKKDEIINNSNIINSDILEVLNNNISKQKKLK